MICHASAHPRVGPQPGLGDRSAASQSKPWLAFACLLHRDQLIAPRELRDRDRAVVDGQIFEEDQHGDDVVILPAETWEVVP